MNTRLFAVALVLGAPCGALWAAGCKDSDDEVVSQTDAAGFEASPSPEAGPIVTPDAGDSATPSACGNATGSPQRLLLSINNTTTSELVAFNVADKTVDGRLTYGSSLGVTSSLGSDPYLVESKSDIVARLDAKQPWQVVSTWNVAGDDRVDGGLAYSNPSTVIVPDCTKGYVLRFNRNKIAVIDTTKVADGGAPDSFIDLSSLLQANDKDGYVEMTSAVYVASKKRIYVLLGNIDLTKVATDGYTELCADTKPTIIAIDTTTGALAPLGGTGPGGGIELGGYNPPLGSPLAYDAARDRLIVLSAGCNQDDGKGGAGPIVQRRIEEVDLATRGVKTMLSLDDKGFPAGMVFVDGARAAVSFFGLGPVGNAFFWNPALTTLGDEIPGGLDFAGYDGKGGLLGIRGTAVDGGPGPKEIVSIPFAEDAGASDASITVLGHDPFTNNGGFTSAAEVWPRP